MVPDIEREWIEEELRSRPASLSRFSLQIALVALALVLAALLTCRG
jgi:hypothetical protein